VFPGRTLLANPVAKRYVNPRELGFVPPVAATPLPRITLDASNTDFASNGEFVYTFSGLPISTGFEAVIINGSNVGSIKVVSIYDNADPQRNRMGSTTISISPAWTGSTFTADANAPTLSRAAGGFPTSNTVLTFRDVPLMSDVAISLDGAAP
jgi:hypothetical protein